MSDVLSFSGMEADRGPVRMRKLDTRRRGDQAKVALLDSIASGGFPDGFLPGEERLADELGVSRTTLREALRSLEEEGIVSRQHGVGTRINHHVVRATSLSRIVGFYDLIREAGYEPRIAWTKLREAPASAEVARRLERPEGTPLLLIERLFCADGNPAVHLVEQIPAGEVERAFDAEDVPDSIFAFADEFCRSPIDHTVVEITAVGAAGDILEPLGLTEGDPLLRLLETHYSAGNEPLISSVVDVVARFLRFTVVRKRM